MHEHRAYAVQIDLLTVILTVSTVLVRLNHMGSRDYIVNVMRK